MIKHKGWLIYEGWPGYYTAYHPEYEQWLYAKSVDELKTEIDEL